MAVPSPAAWSPPGTAGQALRLRPGLAKSKLALYQGPGRLEGWEDFSACPSVALLLYCVLQAPTLLKHRFLGRNPRTSAPAALGWVPRMCLVTGPQPLQKSRNFKNSTVQLDNICEVFL